MREGRRLPLPISADRDRWSTVLPERTVLGVVHNITSATRLLDLLSAFEGDARVQVVFSCTGSSALDSGVPEFFTARGMLYVEWEDARDSEEFDLAIATSRGGELHRLRTPLIGTPHGAGYNKRLARNRKPETGNRKPETGNRKPETGNRKPETGAFGLTEEWLVHDGKLIPSAVVLSHAEQLDRLAETCPQALPAAVVAGDPVIDQLRSGLPFREQYRRALGLEPGQRLVVISSTWGRGSALGATTQCDVIRRAMAELPADTFRVLAAVHPNTWHGAHNSWQLHHWFAPLLDSGLLLPPPESETWKAALCAADFLIGDHGSVTLYGHALGIPSILGAFDSPAVAPDSPMHRLGEHLPRLRRGTPLARQLIEAEAQARAQAQAQAQAQAEARAQAQAQPQTPPYDPITSRPGEAAALLRSLFYTWLKLPEPDRPAATPAIPVPPAPPARRALPHVPARYVTADADPAQAATHLTVHRYPAAHQRTQHAHLTSAHLAADVDDPDQRLPRTADVLLVPHDRRADHATYTSRFPHHGLLAYEEPDHGCRALPPDSRPVQARWVRRPNWADFGMAASVVHALQPGIEDKEAHLVHVHAGEHQPVGLLELRRN
ncbi:hypothetical protein QIS99_02905 [Streptomyces sp. B-S-A8]|uniref:Translation initiation factor 2 n=1 Tax=Streptomyces solicavernae TaxID=3043614 RepID=A0ABT6RL75_9ACTN|nr:hypothetical protein [Streptomyces sp. B-S-A8]MDI3385172.1 hypothetical protein [Streptomyces sp. B-S-A8]